MNLAQSVALADMRRQGQATPLPREKKTLEQVCQLLASTLSSDPHDWLSSEEFMLMDVPIHYASTPYPAPKNDVLAALQASATGYSEIIMDLNKRRIGQVASGYVPTVVVLKGQAIVQAARLAGRESVPVWIGKLAAQKLKFIHADHQLSSTELNQKIQQAHNDRQGIDDQGNGPNGPVTYGNRPQVGEVYPMENYHIVHQGGQDYKQKHSVDLPSRKVSLVGKPQPVKQKYVAMNAEFGYRRPRGGASEHKTPGHEAFPHGERVSKVKFSAPFSNRRRGMSIANSASLHGFGSGSGPAYDSGMGTQPAAEKTSMKSGKKKSVKGFAGTAMTDEAFFKQRGASHSEMQTKLKEGGSKIRHSGMEGSGGYTGYEKGTPTLQQKFRGGSKSEMSPQLEAAVMEFEAAVEAGTHVPDMKNTAPPGMENVVQALKKKFGEKSLQPFQIAWHMHQKKGK